MLEDLEKRASVTGVFMQPSHLMTRHDCSQKRMGCVCNSSTYRTRVTVYSRHKMFLAWIFEKKKKNNYHLSEASLLLPCCVFYHRVKCDLNDHTCPPVIFPD